MKRLFALLLACVLVLGMLPVTALATEEEIVQPSTEAVSIPTEEGIVLPATEEMILPKDETVPQTEETEPPVAEEVTAEELPAADEAEVPEAEETENLVVEEFNVTNEPANVASDYSVYVGGVGMNDGDYLPSGATETTTAAPADCYAFYTEGVLVLHNFSYSGEKVIDSSIIFSEENLSVVLEGSNTVTYTGTKDKISGLKSAGDLVIQESTGSIAINGSYYGIYAGETLIINHSKIMINVGQCGIQADYLEIYNGVIDIVAISGIFVTWTIDIENAEINIQGSTGIGLSVRGYSEYEFPYVNIRNSNLTIEADGDGIWVCSEVDLSGSNITITAGKCGIYTFRRGYDSGIRISGGNFEITSQYSSICSMDNGVAISDGNFVLTGGGGISARENVSISGGDFVITADTGLNADENVSISGGNLEITSVSYGISVDSYYTADKRVSISGGNLRITSEENGIEAAEVSISGGDLTVKSTNTENDSSYCAISGELTVDLSMKIEASTNVDGTLGIYDAEKQSRYDYIRVSYWGEVFLGDIGLRDGEYLAVGATETTTTKPEDHYVYYNDGQMTLHNYSYVGDVNYLPAILCTNRSLTITLEGTNTLSYTGTKTISGIRSASAPLVINKSDGSLEIIATGNGIEAADEHVYSDKVHISIKGGNLTIHAGDHGLYAYGKIEINGGILTIDADYTGIIAEGGLTIKNGKTEITAGESGVNVFLNEGAMWRMNNALNIRSGDLTIDAGYSGVVGGNGNSEISGGNIHITGMNGMSLDFLQISGGNTEINAKETGIYAYFTIKSGDIKIVAGGDGIISSDDSFIYGGNINIEAGTDGIYADVAHSDFPLTHTALTIAGGDILISAKSNGIVTPYIMAIKGGNLHINAGYDGIISNSSGTDPWLFPEPISTINISGGDINVTADHYGICGNLGHQGGNLSVKSTNTENDAWYWAINDKLKGSFAPNIKVQASTEHDGKLGAYVKEKNNSYDYIVTVQLPPEPLAAPVVTAAVDPVTGGAWLAWEAVAGADSYEVYRATSSKGKYSKVDTVTEAEAVVSVAAGKTHYFKVKAICEADAELNSAFSKVAKATGKCAQPEITVETKASNGKPVIKWSKVSGAKKYTVYRATSEDGKYAALKTVTSTSYTDTSAEPGTTYFYKVKALGSKSTYNGVDSQVKSGMAVCAQPALTVKIDAATGKAALSWKAITGAVSYDIYRATAADGEFEKIANQTEVSYKDLDAAANTDYWYKVQAIAEDEALNSADSAVKKTHTTLAKPVVTFAVDDASGKPMLTWEEVEGAVEYQVYRSTKSTSSYKKVNTTTDLSYTDTSVAVAKGYYYKVIAVGENVKSAYSAYKKLTAKCAQPVVTLDVNDNGQPVLKWEKVAGASKYTVYRTDETGEEVSLGTTTKLTYTDKKAVEGATYIYRVVANGSKSTYNSTYSEPVSCAFDATKPVLNTKLLDLGGKNLAEISAVLGEYTQVENYYWFDQGNVAYVFTYGEDMGSNYIQGSLKCVLDHCPETVSEKQLKNYFPGGETVYDAMNDFDCFAWDYRNCTLVILPDSNGKYTADSIIYYNCDMLVPIPPAAGEWGSTDGNNKAAVTVTGITDTELVCAFLYEQMNAPYRINETEIVTLTSQDGVTYTASGVQDSWENVWNVTVTIQTRSAVVTWECTQVGPMANFSFSDFTVFW